MNRFRAIEGLRSVLAWAVVFSHLVYFSDIYTHGFGALPAAIVLAVIEGAFGARLFGHFYQPSFLPAAATYFAIGIACRLIYPSVVGSTRYPIGIAALIIIMLLPISWCSYSLRPRLDVGLFGAHRRP
jgi:hypothetical protein